MRDFVGKVIQSAILCGNGKRKVYISRLKGESERWFVRRKTRFTEIADQTCMDVSNYRRNFGLLK